MATFMESCFYLSRPPGAPIPIQTIEIETPGPPQL